MNGRGNVGVGGNDPTRASQIQGVSNVVNPPAPPGVPMPQAGAEPPAPQNEVAMHLAAAYEALSRTGPTPENLAALQGFLASLKQMGEGIPAAPGPVGPGGPPGPVPGGQAPLPPMGGQAPLPQM